MDLFVGQTSLKGDFRRYAREFKYVELLAEPQQLPTVKKIATLAQQTKGEVQFGVVLSPRWWDTGGDDLFSYFKKVARACAPTWLVVRTPSSVRPGLASERELAKRFELLSPLTGADQDVRVAWEARGLWETAMVERVAASLGVIPVWDGLTLPSGELGEGDAYVRFPELGVGSRVNEGRLERLAVKAQSCQRLFVVVEGRGAQRTRQILEGLLSDPFAGLDAGEEAADGETGVSEDGSAGGEDWDEDEFDEAFDGSEDE